MAQASWAGYFVPTTQCSIGNTLGYYMDDPWRVEEIPKIVLDSCGKPSERAPHQYFLTSTDHASMREASRPTVLPVELRRHAKIVLSATIYILVLTKETTNSGLLVSAFCYHVSNRDSFRLAVRPPLLRASMCMLFLGAAHDGGLCGSLCIGYA